MLSSIFLPLWIFQHYRTVFRNNLCLPIEPILNTHKSYLKIFWKCIIWVCHQHHFNAVKKVLLNRVWCGVNASSGCRAMERTVFCHFQGTVRKSPIWGILGGFRSFIFFDATQQTQPHIQSKLYVGAVPHHKKTGIMKKRVH